MKVLKGQYKGVELTVPPSGIVRPTVDHLKKNIFTLTQSRKINVVWDLYAGGGGVGIEFLSQGADEAIFVEQIKEAYNCLRLNLAECNLKDQALYSKQKILTLLQSVESFLLDSNLTLTPPDLVFLDPPYGMDLKKPLGLLLSCRHVTEAALLLVEHVSQTLPTDFENHIVFQEVYGPKTLTALKR